MFQNCQVKPSFKHILYAGYFKLFNIMMCAIINRQGDRRIKHIVCVKLIAHGILFMEHAVGLRVSWNSAVMFFNNKIKWYKWIVKE